MARHVRNVHTREIDAPASAVGALVDGLGGPDDALWPSPPWPPVRLDRPLGPGASGGHGPIRYTCTEFEPGRRVAFTFDAPTPARGTHEFTVEPLGPGRTRLRHVLEATFVGSGPWLWPLAIRWLHDALLEDLLDRAQTAAGTPPARPHRWSPWVRLLVAATRRAPVSRDRAPVQ
jgi:hypothetical protein